jgi:hypothetical protein
MDDSELSHLRQLKELMLRFAEANGREAKGIEELERWASDAGIEKPVIVRPEITDSGQEEHKRS